MSTPNLTAARIAKITKPGLSRDRGEGAIRGLYLQVTEAERQRVRSAKFGVTRSWIFRFVSPVTRKKRWMALGGLADGIGQADARDLALAARRLVKLGKDPIDERERERAAARLERAKQLTFAECADAYIAKQASEWTNAKHARQWRASIDLANEAFGDQPVGEIDKTIIGKFLAPIWKRTPESASRLRNRIEKVLDWAVAAGARAEGPNPARWGGNLEHLFTPVQSGAHFAALPFDEVPVFVAELREHDTVAALALELLILTAARTAEVVGATWEEIDFKAKVWTIPGHRMKAGRAHSVPLSDRAVEILEGLRTDGSGAVFIGTKLGVPLGSSSLLKQLHAMGRQDLTVHGLRSSFCDWAGDCTDFEEETIEFALSHGIPDQAAKKAYRRYTALSKRRALMDLWAAYCDGQKIEGATVTPMIRAAR
jgi:integrase